MLKRDVVSHMQALLRTVPRAAVQPTVLILNRAPDKDLASISLDHTATNQNNLREHDRPDEFGVELHRHRTMFCSFALYSSASYPPQDDPEPGQRYHIQIGWIRQLLTSLEIRRRPHNLIHKHRKQPPMHRASKPAEVLTEIQQRIEQEERILRVLAVRGASARQQHLAA